MGKRILKKPKIILVPYPAQGHVTPMVKLGSAFLSHGFEPIILTPEFIHHKITASMEPMAAMDGLRFLSIPDGIDRDVPRDFFAIEKAMESVMPKHLESIIHKVEEGKGEGGGGRVVCMVIDLLASWAIEVANRCEIPVAGFWTAMEATYRLITAIPDMLHSHIISKTGCPQHQGTICSLPSQPMLSTEDLPWLIGTQAARNARFKFWTKTLERSATLPWILVNSFPQKFIMEYDNDDDHENIKKPIIFPVVPLCKPSMAKNSSFWEEDVSCLDWLDNQKPNSVLYISFGSWVSPIGDSKVKSLALTLEALRRPFLWVLAPAWRHGLPNGYLERVSKQGRGKVVAWAPQLQVLRHKAVGLYLTHCGWNSTMEAIQCRKRLLCYPVAGDQFVNCKYIVKVWRIGVKVGGFGQKDVEEALRKVMEDGEMVERLEMLYERTMGDEACSRIAANLKVFLLDSINKQFTKSLKNVKDYNL